MAGPESRVNSESAVMTANEREETISLLNFSLTPSALCLGTALSLQRRPEGERAGIEFKYDKRGFISPENLWRDPRVELIARVL